MHCWVYKGERRQNTYLYVCHRDNFQQVPEGLLELLGKLNFVVDVKLDENRKLAQVDAKEVMKQLQADGYYLQMPPGDAKAERIC